MKSNRGTTVRCRLYGSVLLATFVFCGCGQRSAEPGSLTKESVAMEPATETAAVSTAVVESTTGTNEAPAGAAAFSQALQESPFADAGGALKETYARALIAYQIGDSVRALQELDLLGSNAELSPAQNRAVQELIEKTKAADPAAATNAVLTPSTNTPGVYSLAASGEEPFSTSDPAVAESYKRAKAAFDLGDYPNALAQLKELVGNPQLNWQQKYEVQAMLDKTPQVVPGVSEKAAPKP